MRPTALPLATMRIVDRANGCPSEAWLRVGVERIRVRCTGRNGHLGTHLLDVEWPNQLDPEVPHTCMDPTPDVPDQQGCARCNPEKGVEG